MVSSLDWHTIPNLFASNNVASQSIKQKPVELNEEIDKPQSQ